MKDSEFVHSLGTIRPVRLEKVPKTYQMGGPAECPHPILTQ
jgi:hypothetical protein